MAPPGPAVKNSRPKKNDPGLAWDNAAKTLVCLVFLMTPLIIGWWTSDLWESHKLLFLLLAVSAGWLCYWVAILQRGTIAWNWASFDWLVVGVVVMTGISTAASIRPLQSFVSPSGWYGDTLIALIALVGLYILTSQLFRRRHDQVLGWSSLLSGLVITTLLQLFQFSHFSLWPLGAPRQLFFNSISNSTVHLSVIVAMVGSAAMLGWAAAQERWMKLVMMAGVAMSWIALVFIAQTAGWAVFALGMIVVVLSQARPAVKANTGLVGLAVGLATLGMIAQFTTVTRFSSLGSVREPQLDARTSLATVGQTWLHHSLLGSGPATWYYDFVSDRPLSFNSSPWWNLRFTQAGSQLESLVATTGIFGLIAWAALLIVSALRLWRQWQKKGGALSALSLLVTLTILLSAFFSTWSLVLLMVFWATLGLSRAAESTAEPKSLGVWSGLSFALTAMLVLAWMYPAARVYASDIITQQAFKAINRTEPIAQVQSRLQRALNLNPHNLSAVNLLANSYVVELKLGLQKSDSSQTQVLTQKIARELDRMIKIDPKNPVPYEIGNNILSDLTGIIAEVELQAQKNFQTLRRIEPTNPVHDLGYGQTLLVERSIILSKKTVTDSDTSLAKKLVTDAITAFDQAIQKKPDYLQAHLSRVDALEAAGRYTEAVAEVQPLLAANPKIAVLWLARASALSLLQRPDEAVKDYDQALRLDPNNPIIYLAYADHFHRANDVAKVKEILQRGLATLPGQAQLQQALQSLP